MKPVDFDESLYMSTTTTGSSILLDLFIRHSSGSAAVGFFLRPVKERLNMTSLYITIRTVTETIVPKKKCSFG